MSTDANSKIQLIAAEYATSWARALEGMTGEQPESHVDPAAAAGSGTAWWEHRINLPEAVPVWVGADPEVSESVGKKVLEAAGVQDASAEEVKSTFLEVAAQAISAWASGISNILDRGASSDGAYEPRNPDPAATQVAITAAFGGDVLGPIFIAFPPALFEQPVEKPEPKMPAPQKQEPARAEIAPLSSSVQSSRTLDLLLEVELPVSVSFGRAKLPLKDVLKLTSGAIVELNRSISEPVEVIVNNCVIARGEVVVVEGYYGIRIQQIVSKQERLRSLN